MSKEEYNHAINYFNQNSACTMDQIRCTYDADQNALIMDHYKAKIQSNNAQTFAILAGGIALIKANDAINWVQNEDSTIADAPIASVGLVSLFAIAAAKKAWDRRKTIKAVERNVQADQSSTYKPTF